MYEMVGMYIINYLDHQISNKNEGNQNNLVLSPHAFRPSDTMCP